MIIRLGALRETSFWDVRAHLESYLQPKTLKTLCVTLTLLNFHILTLSQVWAIESALYNQDDPLGYLQSDLIRFCGLGINSAFRSSNQHMLPEAIRPASTRSTNIDNDALTRQSRTMVTPRILDLCEKYFPETLTRLGRRVTVSKLQAKAQKIAERTAAEDFGSFCRRFHGSYGRRRKIEYSGKRTRDFIESVTIDNEIYEVSDKPPHACVMD